MPDTSTLTKEEKREIKNRKHREWYAKNREVIRQKRWLKSPRNNPNYVDPRIGRIPWNKGGGKEAQQKKYSDWLTAI